MKITINNKEYTAPAPVTGLWFALQKIKTDQKKRVEQLAAAWELVKPLENAKDLTDDELSKLDVDIAEISNTAESNKLLLLESKIKMIVDAYNNPDITKDTILQYLPLHEVSIEYAKIENWLNDIVIGRTEQLPNAETPEV